MQCVYPGRRTSRDRTISAHTLIDDLEHVSVDRLTKEKALEWRWAKRREYMCAFGFEPTPERVEFREWIEHCDVPSELVFEWGDAEPLDIEHVQLLAATQIQPHQFYGRIRRHRQTRISERPLEERRRLFNLAGWQCQVGKSHSVARGSRLKAQC